MNNGIGFKIKKLREQKEISQEDLSYYLDISQSYLSKIENGVIEKIDFLFMQKVADFF
jgi:transcriptional regulator with XRE-family HTH domain